MNRTTAALTAALFLFIATAGSAFAAGTGSAGQLKSGGTATTQQSKVRQQNEKQLQINKKSDGPQTQVRQRNRSGY